MKEYCIAERKIMHGTDTLDPALYSLERLIGIGISIMNLIRFIMGIPIPVKRRLSSEQETDNEQIYNMSHPSSMRSGLEINVCVFINSFA